MKLKIKNLRELKLSRIKIIMVIFLQVVQMLGLGWRKKKLKKKEDVCKLTMFLLKLIGKSKPKVLE